MILFLLASAGGKYLSAFVHYSVRRTTFVINFMMVHFLGRAPHTKIFFFYIYYNPWGARKGTFLRILVSFQSGTEKYRLIILLYLHLLSCSSTLDLLFFSGSGASTLARELEPLRPWLDVGVNQNVTHYESGVDKWWFFDKSCQHGIHHEMFLFHNDLRDYLNPKFPKHNRALRLQYQNCMDPFGVPWAATRALIQNNLPLLAIGILEILMNMILDKHQSAFGERTPKQQIRDSISIQQAVGAYFWINSQYQISICFLDSQNKVILVEYF